MPLSAHVCSPLSSFVSLSMFHWFLFFFLPSPYPQSLPSLLPQPQPHTHTHTSSFSYTPPLLPLPHILPPSSLFLDLCLSPHPPPLASTLRPSLPPSDVIATAVQDPGLAWQCPSFDQRWWRRPDRQALEEVECAGGARGGRKGRSHTHVPVWHVEVGCTVLAIWPDSLWARSALGCSIFNDVTHSGMVQQAEQAGNARGLEWTGGRHADVSQGRGRRERG